jgi:uncharacterized protein
LEKFFASLILSLGILFSGFFISKSIYYFKDFERSVKVKGLDEKMVKSDLAIFTISFSQSSEKMQDVYKTFSISQEKIINFLIAKGVKKDEIEKSSLDVSDNRTQAQEPGRSGMPKFTGTSKIIVSSSNVEQVKTISQEVSELIEKGVGISFSDIKFFFTDLNSIKTEMLDRAVKNAYDAANSFASQTGSKLGPIKNASQGLFTIADANTTEEWATYKSMQKKVRVVVGVDYFLK